MPLLLCGLFEVFDGKSEEKKFRRDLGERGGKSCSVRKKFNWGGKKREITSRAQKANLLHASNGQAKEGHHIFDLWATERMLSHRGC